MSALDKLLELYPSRDKITDEVFRRIKSRKIKSIIHGKAIDDAGKEVKVEMVKWLEPAIDTKMLREETVAVERELMKKWKAMKDPIFDEFRKELGEKYPETEGRSTEWKFRVSAKLANGFPDIERVFKMLGE